MVKHPWPLLEISLSDFCRLATLNIFTYIQQRSLFDTQQTEGFYLLLGFYCSYFSQNSLISLLETLFKTVRNFL